MAQKMLIDATHAEETRVVVVDGNKVEEFDFETANRRQLAGNIYLAKVTRVEPSLQAAFVDYGGNRHGFLAFNEIHPDYYQIPAADRAAVLAEEQALADEGDGEEDTAAVPEKPARKPRRGGGRRKASAPAAIDADDQVEAGPIAGMDIVEPEGDGDARAAEAGTADAPADDTPAADGETGAAAAEAAADDEPYSATDHATDLDERIESVSDGDPIEEARPRRKPRPRRYKIQEVVKVRQIMLVQVVKEERGTKGAALTTYLSLAGRYCVLMPNTARGGGISRKITAAADRQKLKAIAAELTVPEGAGLIIRTAGANRTRAEIKRDYEYLLRLWEQIRELTLKSIAPTPIYEEGNLIKRAIRDLYNKQIDEVLVEGEPGYRVAKDFMKMIMPSHAKNVKQYADPLPLFARYQVESYLGGMFNPTVQLPSGGYIVIGITEALVAIDINSGRATREGSIEDTALKTNLEAAEEIARQLRLRDLAGLIVIDFIDMEERKNNAAVEKMLKDKLKSDRARIQVGRISGFGLLEMSRQRLRPGMLEATTQPCASCHGTGLIRSDDSLGLGILRQIEEEGTRGKTREVLVRAPAAVINFIMNTKREHVAQIEARYGMAVRLEADPRLVSPDFEIEKFKTASRVAAPQAPVVSLDATLMPELEEDEPEGAAAPDASPEPETQSDEGNGDEGGRKKRRRRRRRRGGKDGDTQGGDAAPDTAAPDAATPEADTAGAPAPAAGDDAAAEKPKRSRRSRARKPKDDAATPPEAPATADGSADATDEAAAKKPAKRTRSRRKPAKDAAPVADAAGRAADDAGQDRPAADHAAPAAPATAPDAASVPEPGAPAPDESPAPGADAPATAPDAAEPDATPAQDAPAEPAPATPAAPEPAMANGDSAEGAAPKAPAKPRRRGWWAVR